MIYILFILLCGLVGLLTYNLKLLVVRVDELEKKCTPFEQLADEAIGDVKEKLKNGMKIRKHMVVHKIGYKK